MCIYTCDTDYVASVRSGRGPRQRLLLLRLQLSELSSHKARLRQRYSYPCLLHASSSDLYTCTSYGRDHVQCTCTCMNIIMHADMCIIMYTCMRNLCVNSGKFFLYCWFQQMKGRCAKLQLHVKKVEDQLMVQKKNN